MSIWFGLFLSALASATLLPGASEAALLALLESGETIWLLWLVATLGNTLGAMINWSIGRYLAHFQDRDWFPVSATTFERVHRWYLRFGIWSLLFAWLPLVGDALPLIAGVLRSPLLTSLVLLAIGKGARYALLILAWKQLA